MVWWSQFAMSKKDKTGYNIKNLRVTNSLKKEKWNKG